MEKKHCELCQDPLTDSVTWYDMDCRHRIFLCSEACNQALEQLLQRRKQVAEDLQRYRERLVADVQARRRRSVKLEEIRARLERLYQL